MGANNALETVVALSARGTNPQSIAATALLDILVRLLRGRVELDEDVDPAAIAAARMVGPHLLMAAIHEAAGACLHTHEETEWTALAPPHAAVLPTQL